MKKVLLLPVVLLTLLLASFAPAGNWVKYTSAAGHFTMSFPVKPNENAQTDSTADKTPYQIHYATCSPVDTEVYVVAWTDMTPFYPKDKTMQQILEESRDGVTGSMHAIEVTTINTNLGKDPFIEFTFKTPEYIGKERVYVINKFQYSLISLGSLQSGVSSNMDRFLASFKHLP